MDFEQISMLQKIQFGNSKTIDMMESAIHIKKGPFFIIDRSTVFGWLMTFQI